MRAIVCRKYGLPGELAASDVPEPVPGPGQIAIDVHAAGVNFPDVLMVQGLYQVKPPVPFVPGIEVSGIVSAVGPNVAAFVPGDRVAASTIMGGFAERAIANVSHAVALPEAIDFTAGAGIVLTYGTAYHALVDCAGLRAGEILTVSGAGGGVGIAAVALGRALGARVVAIASSPEKRAAALAAGAEAAIDSGGDVLAELKAATAGGAHVALDNVGGAIFDATIRSMRWQGRALVVGFAGGTIPSVAANRVLLKELTLRGVYWGDWTMREPERNRANFARMFELAASGAIAPHAERVYPFDEAVAAIVDLGERRAVGKSVVRVRP